MECIRVLIARRNLKSHSLSFSLFLRSHPVVNVVKLVFGGNQDFAKIKKLKKFVPMSEPGQICKSNAF